MLDKSYEFFMKADMKPYIDEWVAIVDGKVVSHGRNVKCVFAQAKKEYPKSRPVITKIPGEQAMIL